MVRLLVSVNFISVLFRELLSEAIATISRQRREREREVVSLSERFRQSFPPRGIEIAAHLRPEGDLSLCESVGRVHAYILSTYVYYPGWSAYRLNGVERRGEGYMYTRMSRYVQVQNA